MNNENIALSSLEITKCFVDFLENTIHKNFSNNIKDVAINVSHDQISISLKIDTTKISYVECEPIETLEDNISVALNGLSEDHCTVAHDVSSDVYNDVINNTIHDPIHDPIYDPIHDPIYDPIHDPINEEIVLSAIYDIASSNAHDDTATDNLHYEADDENNKNNKIDETYDINDDINKFDGKFGGIRLSRTSAYIILLAYGVLICSAVCGLFINYVFKKR
jgi:hypothetical protein